MSIGARPHSDLNQFGLNVACIKEDESISTRQQLDGIANGSSVDTRAGTEIH